MGKANIRLIRVVPGAQNLKPILDSFCSKGDGIVTAFSDLRLRTCHNLLPALHSVELLEFGRVTGHFLAKSGGHPLGLAPTGHVLASIAEACSQLPDDSPFEKSKNFPGLHVRVARCLDELRSWGFTAVSFADLAERVGGTTAEKLRSLAFVEAEVQELLRQLGRQHNAERIADSVGVDVENPLGMRLLVLAGSNDDPVKMRWLQWAAEAGADVTVVSERHAFTTNLFKGSANIEAALEVPPEEAGTGNLLTNNLFSSDVAIGQPLEVSLMSTADSFAECEWTLRKIVEELQDGASPDDIAIYCRGIDEYAPLVETAARRFGIPVRSARRIPVLSNSLAKLTLQALEFCVSDDVRKLQPVLKSSYLQLTAADQTELRDRLREFYKARDRQWPDLYEWATQNKDRFDWLFGLLQWRKEVMEEPAPLAVWNDRFRDLGPPPWNQKESSRSAPIWERDQYAQQAMQRAVANAATVDRLRGNHSLNLAQFTGFCRHWWKETDVSLPFGPVGIQLVSSAEELGEVRSLYVLGMLEGVFPRRRSEDPVLDDEDRKRISETVQGLPPLGDSHRIAQEERDEFYRVCCAPSEKLVLSYPQTGEDRDNVPAFYMTEVQKILGSKVQTINIPRTKWTPDEPAVEADERLRRALEGPKEEPLPNQLVSENAKSVARGNLLRAYAPQELRDVLRCPFQYLSSRRLGVRSHRLQSRWYRLLSLPASSNLIGHDSPEAATKQLEQELDVQLADLLGDTLDHDLTLIRTGGRRLIKEWVEREFESRKIWPRQDNPTLNVSFENGHLRRSLKVEGGNIELSGRLPAISNKAGYKVLHLFMAHDPWEDRADMIDDSAWRRISERDQFELALYLCALRTPGDGVGIEVDSISGTRRLFLMPRPETHPPKNPTKGFNVNVIEREQIGDMARFVANQVGRAIGKIRSGDVEPTPGESCRYCDHGELCRRSAEFGEDLDPFMREADVPDDI